MTIIRVFDKIISIPDEELLSETAAGSTALHCFICGHRRVYRMICLVLHTYVINDERWNPMNYYMATK